MGTSWCNWQLLFVHKHLKEGMAAFQSTNALFEVRCTLLDAFYGTFRSMGNPVFQVVYLVRSL